MAWIDAVMASSSGGSSVRQWIVSRMMSGGSAGLMMMIALPRFAPPTRSTALAVVRVNSSMFCRVPGPTEREATVATISAYSTGCTRLTAATIGMVAWPPHVTMFTLRRARADVLRRFTGGMQYGPIAAGVRSIISTPSGLSLRAFSWCAWALVASKAMLDGVARRRAGAGRRRRPR